MLVQYYAFFLKLYYDCDKKNFMLNFLFNLNSKLYYISEVYKKKKEENYTLK